MPEEVNRLVTDRLSDLLLTPDRISVNNLKKEGVPESAIHFVGNIMIDTLEANRERAVKLNLNQIVSSNSVLEKGETDIKENDFALMTLHRPSNVDEKRILSSLVDFVLKEVASVLTVIWSVHPRTEKQLKKFDLWDRLIQSDEVYLVNPLGYHEMLRLNMLARIMLTDSGGLQEECTVLGTPCLTMRWNTERPITLREHGGASVLVGNNVARIREEFFNTLNNPRQPERPELWDGHTSERCLKAILEWKG